MFRLRSLYVRQESLIAHVSELAGRRFHLTLLGRVHQHRVAVPRECVCRADAEFEFILGKWSGPQAFWLALLDEPGYKRLFAVKKREPAGIATIAPIECRQP